MAIQSSSAAFPSSSSNATSSNSGGGGSNFFSPSGSPPLILAFLAIGLFTAAMITVFGWRRMHFGRGWVVPDANGAGGVGRRAGFGEKPRLWDLWTENTVGTREGEARWHNIMPFSATTFSDKSSPINDSPNAGPASTPMNIPQHLDHFRRQVYRLRHKSSVGNNTKINQRQASDTHLQVAVVIAMPSPHNLANSINNGPATTPGSRMSRHDNDERLEYSIGLIEVPWRSEEG